MNRPTASPGTAPARKIARCFHGMARRNDQTISAWVEYEGRRFLFERAAPPGQFSLSEHELLLAGALIYRQQEIATTA